MPEMIRNDYGQLAGYIYIDLQSITATDYVAAARQYLLENLNLPTGYSLVWTGTYQYTEEVLAKLIWIIPLALVITFSLLMRAFKSVTQSTLIFLSAPFALIGGAILQWIQGYAMTMVVIIGYIAVLATAIQTGILMVEFIREALADKTDNESYTDAVIMGSIARLQSKLMIVTTTVLGLIPVMLATGSGMEITQLIAAPIVGGMVSSTIYVLFLIPCMFIIG